MFDDTNGCQPKWKILLTTQRHDICSTVYTTHSYHAEGKFNLDYFIFHHYTFHYHHRCDQPYRVCVCVVFSLNHDNVFDCVVVVVVVVLFFFASSSCSTIIVSILFILIIVMPIVIDKIAFCQMLTTVLLLHHLLLL